MSSIRSVANSNTALLVLCFAQTLVIDTSVAENGCVEKLHSLLQNCTCKNFIAKLYMYNVHVTIVTVLYIISSLTDVQVRQLSSTKLPLLYSTLRLFVKWLKDGLYDFSSLPRALKARPQNLDLDLLDQIPAKYPGDCLDLLTELKGLIEVLLHTEPHLIKEVNGLTQV